MKKLLAAAALLVVANYAFANNMTLAYSNRALVCTSSNLVKVEVNAQRTAIRISQAGEVWGQEPVMDNHTDGRTYVSYFTRNAIVTFKRAEAFLDLKQTGQTIQLKCR